MRIANRTPFLVGYKVGSQSPPRPDVTLIVRATYALKPGAKLTLPEGLPVLAQGSLTADMFADGDDERATACQYPSDFADYKRKTDLMLRGTCHCPGGKPVTECPVRFSVGSWSKTLMVVGPRVWSGDTITQPVPFSRTPITFENAFGGAGHAQNPVGKGIHTRELPTLELLTERIESRRDRPAPACFGPINPAWPERANKLGKQYGEAWRRSRSPFYAEDFDADYFQAAPPDQRLDAPLRGDEEISFLNLHPEAPLFSARLPGLRIRAFLADVSGRFREVGMRLDTLFADVDAGRLFLTWRGVEPVAEVDLTDVEAALIADEPLHEEPLSEAHYRAAMAAFQRDPTGMESAVAEPLRHAHALIRERSRRAPTDTLTAGPTSQDPISALLSRELGPVAKQEQRQVQSAVAAALRAPLPSGIHLGASIKEALRGASKSPPTAPAFDPSAPARAPLGPTLRPVLDKIDRARISARARNVDVSGLDPIDAIARDLKAEERSPTQGEGPDLSGEDLSGRDLRGADLRGANLTDADLRGADLRGANLAGATLTRAILAEALLEGADLENANLKHANLSHVRAEKARFVMANLEGVNAPGATLTGAILREARAQGALFKEAILDGVDARRVEFAHGVFDNVSMVGADFTGARLLACRFLHARAEKARFVKANLLGSSFADADLTEASLLEVEGPCAIFLRAKLGRADFSYGVLPESHFSEASAPKARFRAADLSRARLYRAHLEECDFTTAGLLHADLRRSRLTGARFSGANLYHADFTGAAVERCDFTGGILKRSSLETG